MSEVVLVVSLWIYPGQEAAFEAFERDASSIIDSHGGRIDRAVRIGVGQGDSPYEVHVVAFPSESAFDSYRSDPRTRELGRRRELIITKTTALTGEFAGPY